MKITSTQPPKELSCALLYLILVILSFNNGPVSSYPPVDMPSFQLVEPHPSIYPSQKTFTTRGGYGNVTSPKNMQTAGQQKDSRPPSLTLSSSCESCSSSSSSHYYTGRGGSGNVHHNNIEQRAIFSFDEELEHEARMYAKAKVTPIYTTVGRGGAGNICSTASPHTTSDGRELLSPVQEKQLRDSYLEHYREVQKDEEEQRRINQAARHRRRERERQLQEQEEGKVSSEYSDETEVEDMESETSDLKLGQGGNSSQSSTSVATQLTNSLKSASKRTIQRIWGSDPLSSS